MIKKNKLYISAVIISLFSLLVISGTAFSFSVNLNTPNVSTMPIMDYATVEGTVSSIDNSIFHFEVDITDSLKTLLNGGNNFGIDQFYFNTDLELASNMFKNFDPETWNIFYNKNVSGFGEFDIKLKDPKTNTRPDHLYFDIDYTSAVTEDNFFLLSEGKAGKGNGNFAAHIAGFNYNGEGSVFVRDSGSPVPEPGTIMLLGSGLVGVAALGRKRFKK